MNREAKIELRKQWREMTHLKANIAADLNSERAAKVEKLKAAGLGDPGFPLFAAFDKDVMRCASGRLTPEKALERLDEHLKAWQSGDPRYQ